MNKLAGVSPTGMVVDEAMDIDFEIIRHNERIWNEIKRREILFRKFQVAKRSNHRKYVPHIRIHTLREYVPQVKLIKALVKLEKKHENTNPKAVLKLARLEKKGISLMYKLRSYAYVGV